MVAKVASGSTEVGSGFRRDPKSTWTRQGRSRNQSVIRDTDEEEGPGPGEVAPRPSITAAKTAPTSTRGRTPKEEGIR